MKKYINMSLMMALFAMFTLCFISCGDDDDDKPAAPTIVIKEANIEDGDIVCVQADIKAEGRTKNFMLTINGKDGKEKTSLAMVEDKYTGKLNIDGFHVHVDIKGRDVVEGDVLTLIVYDAEGQSGSAKKEITAEEE